MTWMILLPALVAVWWISTRSAPRAVTDIYIPMLLLFPLYYEWKLTGLPPLNATEAIVIVLLYFMLLRHRYEFYFSRTDIWVLLFVYGGMISEVLRRGVKPGLFELAGDIYSALLPYMVGKILIEQHGMRVKLLKRMAFLLFLVCVISIYEYRMSINPYHEYLDRYFPYMGTHWFLQMRWGRARVSGPFAHAILAAMMFFAGAMFNFYLLRTNSWERKFRWLKLGAVRKGWVIMTGLFLGLYMTQSRGPWVATPVGFVVTAIGLARNPRRAFLRFAFVAIVIGVVAYPFIQDYTAGTTLQATDQDQQNAVYRRQLIDNYTPVVEAGGFWGWGLIFPVVGNQVSIDNEYLLIALQRGYFGLLVFVLLAGETLVKLVRQGISPGRREDRILAFCMVGTLAGILFSVTTVFLGMQVYTLFFFLVGWSQAIGRQKPEQFPMFEEVYV